MSVIFTFLKCSSCSYIMHKSVIVYYMFVLSIVSSASRPTTWTANIVVWSGMPVSPRTRKGVRCSYAQSVYIFPYRRDVPPLHITSFSLARIAKGESLVWSKEFSLAFRANVVAKSPILSLDNNVSELPMAHRRSRCEISPPRINPCLFSHSPLVSKEQKTKT